MIAIYVDANVLISGYESTTERADQALRVFDAVAEGEFKAVTSELTLAEVLSKPFSLGQTDLSDLYEKLLSGRNYIGVVPVTRSILIDAAKLRAGHSNVRLPDAIHLATATDSGCTAVLSDDRRLPTVANMRLVRLSPRSLDDLRRGPR